ncbi:hypothetical protein ABMA27_010300 [Loxostege sticticalis]|uniref:Peptidase A2 domain-containing protein n=1 Tax=Loxostege sticticalis TaxID=481309 RepID=A0ABR3H5A3_LOXSC
MATSDCNFSGRRLFVTDKNSKVQFLLDTGSDLCIYPMKPSNIQQKCSSFQLNAANGTAINTYGCRTLVLNLRLRRDFKWNFVIADVDMAIIGSDFLAYNNLLPDCRHKLLRDGQTGLTTPASIASHRQQSVKAIFHSDSPFADLLREYPNLTRPPGLPKVVKHNTVHHILTTDGPPVCCRPRRLAPQKMLAAKREIEDMVKCGIARPSNSPWASPLHLAPKKDSTWRPCGDFFFFFFLS